MLLLGTRADLPRRAFTRWRTVGDGRKGPGRERPSFARGDDPNRSVLRADAGSHLDSPWWGERWCPRLMAPGQPPDQRAIRGGFFSAWQGKRHGLTRAPWAWDTTQPGELQVPYLKIDNRP